MSATAEADMIERRDVPIDEAFQVITEGGLAAPNALQRALFPRLLTQDTGLLAPTGPAAGRLEAIFIPSVIGMRTEELAHRLFIIGPDGCPLDDYLYRLCPYLRSLVIADGVARTIWFEEPERTPIARKYLPDGTYLNGTSDHPFNEEVDIIVMPLTHFRLHFFATGGVHGVPEVLGFDQAVAQEMAPRGLFYFDEAFGSARQQQLDFMRMVEFLFAQDLDVVVGSSSLPDSAADAMAFLEPIAVPQAQKQPGRRIQYTPASREDTVSVMEKIVRQVYSKSSRVVAVLNDPEDGRLRSFYERLAAVYPDNVYFYHSLTSRAERGRVYAELRGLEKDAAGYLLIVDGPSLEVSDLDATVLITEPCSALSMVRRAGRCNRRGANPESLIHVAGDLEVAANDQVFTSATRRDSFLAAFPSSAAPVSFDVNVWKQLIA